MNHLFDLTNKVAVITGGNKGLGKDMALGLASAGADIIIIARNVTQDVITDIKKVGVNAVGINFDLKDFDAFDSLIEQILEEFGRIDILVNNAGVQKRHPAVEFPEKDWDHVMDINTKSVFLLCQKIGNYMIKQGGGKIINMASMLSFHGGYTVPAYAASKGAVMQFTKSLSNEWAASGVNVNCIAPGYMKTEMNKAILNDEKRNNEIVARIPAKRWGNPKDLQGTAIFLAAPASDYINGFTLAVDGGYLGR